MQARCSSFPPGGNHTGRVRSSLHTQSGGALRCALGHHLRSRLRIHFRHQGTSLPHPQMQNPQDYLLSSSVKQTHKRLHCSLKTSLRTRLSGKDWIVDLPWVLPSLRTNHKPDLHYSPAQCTLRHQPLLPGGPGHPPSTQTPLLATSLSTLPGPPAHDACLRGS